MICRSAVWLLPATLLLVAGCGLGGVAAAGGVASTTGEDDPDAAPPPVSAVEVSQQAHGFVSVTVSLTDARFPATDANREAGDADPRVRIFPEYRASGTDVWRPMTPAAVPGQEGTRGLALGRRTFIWNSLVDIARSWLSVEVRARAEYEPTHGGRTFRTRSAGLDLDNRLAVTVLGGSLDRTSETGNRPVDIHPDGSGFVVACLGSNILERVGKSGDVERLAGLGTAGETVAAEQDAGVVRLPEITGVALDGAGNPCSTHGSFLAVTNRGASDLHPGGVRVRPGKLTKVLEGLSEARFPRFHPSGALLLVESSDEGSRITGWNPADPGDPSAASIRLGAVLLPPGGAAMIAGGGPELAEGATLLEASFGVVTAIALGPDGEVYLAERDLGRVRVLNLATVALPLGGETVAPGTVATVAGEGLLGDRGDRGPAREARFNLLAGLAVTSNRSLLVVDLQRRPRLRLVNLGPQSVRQAGTTVEPGMVDTIVGGQFDPVGSLAQDLDLVDPGAVAVDGEGRILVSRGTQVIVVNPGEERIHAYGQPVLPGRTASLYDATRRAGLPLQQPRAAHLLYQLDRDLFLTDLSSVRVLNYGKTSADYAGIRVRPGESAVIGGGAVEGFSGDGGSSRQAAFARPSGLASHPADAAGATTPLLYVADNGNDRVRVLHLGEPGVDSDLSAFGITVSAGTVETVVGGAEVPGPDHGDGLSPTDAGLLRPEGIAVSRIGGRDVLLVADTGHHRIRCVNPGTGPLVLGTVTIAPGTIDTVIGDGAAGFTADGPGPWRIDTPTALAVHGPVIFFGEAGNARIRAANFGTDPVTLATITIPPGEIRTLVGTGVKGNSGDGDLGPFVDIDHPRGLFLQTGLGVPLALFFSDHAQHVVRVLNLQNDKNIGVIDDISGHAQTHLAPGAVHSIAGGPNAPGVPNSPGFDGDGGEPASVRFSGPFGLVWTSLDLVPAFLFVADEKNHRLRCFGAPPTRWHHGP